MRTFNSPQDVAVVPDGSAVFVADYANGSIRKVLADGTVSTLPGSFSLPRGLVLSGSTSATTGTLYVAEYAGQRDQGDRPDEQQHHDRSRAAARTAPPTALASLAEFSGPIGLAVDAGGCRSGRTTSCTSPIPAIR